MQITDQGNWQFLGDPEAGVVPFTFEGKNIGRFLSNGDVLNDRNANGKVDPTEVGAAFPGVVFRARYIDTATSESLIVRSVSDLRGFDLHSRRSESVGSQGQIRNSSLGSIQLVLPSGWRLTSIVCSDLTPGLGYTSVTITQRSLVSGTLRNDLNANGVADQGEPSIQGWRVFEDANGNHALDLGEHVTSSDANGQWEFNNLPHGRHRFRLVSTNGFKETAPGGAGDLVVTTHDGEASDSHQLLVQAIGVSGTVFNDIDGNGSRGDDEPGTGAWRVFNDLNNNGRWDKSESITTSTTDGSWSLTLIQGKGRLRCESRDGYPSTLHREGVAINLRPGQYHDDIHFGHQAVVSQGYVFHDVNRDGVRQTSKELGWAHLTLFDDLNGDWQVEAGEPVALTNKQGKYRFADLPSGFHLIRIAPAGLSSLNIFPPPEIQQWFTKNAGEVYAHHFAVPG